ncbi:glycoside hydrolase family 93 protein [Stipitochalara longipes BDJ]|nr:glycoside hydrolase family 93 protein [Stipitochalara longipes BDJ]
MKNAVVTISLATTILCSPVETAVTHLSLRANPTFTRGLNEHIFNPPASWASWRVIYHRAVQLNDGSLLSSWENYAPEPPLEAAPIWRSTDGGKTFSNFSQVTDQVNGWGMRYQPFLYVLPQAFAGLKAGDLLFAGNSVPSNLSKTKIDVYSSTNGGLTWTFMSSVATGGKALASNGATPVWEPFLQLYNGEIICFYSDQRDPLHGQKLTHQTTTDLKTWSATVDDVGDPDYDARPGMTTVIQVGNGNWVMTYENCGPGGCQVNVKVASSPLVFGTVTGYPLQAVDGTKPVSSPFITWVYNGGANGTLIVNAASDSYLYTNTQQGLPGTPWTRINVGTTAAYSRCLHPLGDYDSLIIAGAGTLQTGTYANNVTYSIVSLSALGI